MMRSKDKVRQEIDKLRAIDWVTEVDPLLRPQNVTDLGGGAEGTGG